MTREQGLRVVRDWVIIGGLGPFPPTRKRSAAIIEALENPGGWVVYQTGTNHPQVPKWSYGTGWKRRSQKAGKLWTTWVRFDGDEFDGEYPYDEDTVFVTPEDSGYPEGYELPPEPVQGPKDEEGTKGRETFRFMT